MVIPRIMKFLSSHRNTGLKGQANNAHGLSRGISIETKLGALKGRENLSITWLSNADQAVTKEGTD